MYIADNYLHSDFEDAKLHLKEMLRDTLEEMQMLQNENELSFYDSVDTLNIIIEFANSYDINNKILLASSPTTSLNIIKLLDSYYFDVVAKETSSQYRELFAKKVYILTDDEYDKIQNNINTLRDKIINSKEFSEEHKTRLLEKLEKLQNEIHKKMSSTDKVLGNVVSLGHILGKTTKEAKPFIDEVKDILKIIFKSKEKTENLPDSTNQLETKDLLQIED
jgi:hypothetical protein